MSAWPHAVESIGTVGRHFHDLHHTGNPGRDDHRHEARGGAHQLITNATDAHLQDEHRKDDEDEDGSAGALAPAG